MYTNPQDQLIKIIGYIFIGIVAIALIAVLFNAGGITTNAEAPTEIQKTLNDLHTQANAKRSQIAIAQAELGVIQAQYKLVEVKAGQIKLETAFQ